MLDSKRLIITGLLLLTATVSLAAEAANFKTIELRGGATVSAPVIKEGDDALFVDLGDQILRLARSGVQNIIEPAGQQPPVAAGASAPNPSALPYQNVTARDDAVKINQMLDRVKDAVVVVSNSKGIGSGFFIDAEGRLLTNNHVVGTEKLQKVTIIRKKGLRTERKLIENVELLAHSALFDIALLKLPDEAVKDLALEPLPLHDGTRLNEGDVLWAVGNPGVGHRILEHTVSNGIVSSPNRNFNDVLYIQTTASINPGNSGGPLVNSRGEVIGLVTFRASFQEGIAFALPTSYIHHFLKNEKAYAYDKNNPNLGYRYLKPEEH